VIVRRMPPAGVTALLFASILALGAHCEGPLAAAADEDARLSRARRLLEQQKPGDAEGVLTAYLAQHPDSADAHFLLGAALFRQVQEDARSAPVSSASSRDAKIKASLAEFTEGAKYRAPSAADLKIVALDYVLLNDYANADKWLTKMLEWAPDDGEGWYYLGRTKYNENRFAEAVEAFQRCLKLDPQNVKAEDNLGLSYAGLGRHEEAMAAYKNAIAWQQESAAKNPGPYIDMGSLLLDLNQSADAVWYLREALKISPAEFKAHELLGKAYSRLGQLSEAQRELEKAIRLAPEVASMHCMLGPIYRRQGMLDKAKVELERCAALTGTRSSRETPR
jgi:tetratricopeptide (TPR) repeat protein